MTEGYIDIAWEQVVFSGDRSAFRQASIESAVDCSGEAGEEMVASLLGVGSISRVKSPSLARLAFGVTNAGLEECWRGGSQTWQWWERKVFGQVWTSSAHLWHDQAFSEYVLMIILFRLCLFVYYGVQWAIQ